MDWFWLLRVAQANIFSHFSTIKKKKKKKKKTCDQECNRLGEAVFMMGHNRVFFFYIRRNTVDSRYLEIEGTL